MANTLLESIGIFGVLQNSKFSQFLTIVYHFIFKNQINEFYEIYKISSIFDFLRKRDK